MYNLESWKAKGKLVEVFGHPVFVVDEGAANQTLVISHGYPTCSFDYWKVLPLLTPHFRVIIHDHLGFGLSSKPKKYSYSLVEQAEVALELWRILGVKKAHVYGHDYGTSVVTEIVARWNHGHRPIELESITVGNGSMLIEMADLRVVQKLLRNKSVGPYIAKLTSEKFFHWTMGRLWSDQSKVDTTEFTILWEMLNYNEGRDVFFQVSQYLHDRVKFWHRWIGGLAATDLPVNLLWAEDDPVALVAMAHRLDDLVEHANKRILPGIGHYPMLEDAETWSQSLIEMLSA